jgi:hypothetical protein
MAFDTYTLSGLSCLLACRTSKSVLLFGYSQRRAEALMQFQSLVD